jgi:hypothetical protein
MNKLLFYTSYAVVDPAGNLASGRVEDSMLLHKKFAQSANFLCKSIQKYHAAAGEAGFHRVKRPV